MQVYLVGGAVRDALLGWPILERDWLVTGATPDDMLAQGFKPVGKDFPVFLHPETGEEYALARTERKNGRGYHGFTFHTDPEVTVEQDVLRRDLTINALVQDAAGNIVDYCNGQHDLEQKILRHVSPAFAEDPVRILRVARFAARYHHLGFRIADETLQLMQDMVKAGEVDALVTERIWQECERALGEKNPHIFFDVLRRCGALAVIFPEVDALFGIPQPAQYHPEIDTGLHTLMVVEQCSLLTTDKTARFAALCHDLGKALTPVTTLPRHIGHEQKSEKPVRALCARLGVPNEYRDLAVRVAVYHTHCHRALELRASTLVDLFHDMDLFRRPQRLEPFLMACEADARGRTGFESMDYKPTAFLRSAWSLCSAVESATIDSTRFTGKAFGDELRRLRIAAIEPLAQPGRKETHT
ncbi:MAG TPA: multifunctional CCA addition/repair protein [Pseudomonadales bacterium]|nr:multifunctional CCA addition/repair protein [Pseudomonadales bacterium]